MLAPALWELLCQRDLVIEIASGEEAVQVLLGVPHQAASGVERIAEDWLNPRTGHYGRPADDMAGLLALAVFSAMRERGLSCRLVIAAHATDHDPNKTPASPYWDCMFSSPVPAQILELHGAAHRRRHDLELSAGRNAIADPLTLGRKVAAGLARAGYGACQLAVQLRPGEQHGLLLTGGVETPCRLQNPALQTSLLHMAGQAGIAALHLEAKRIFRQPAPAFLDAPRPTLPSWQLAHALANAVI